MVQTGILIIDTNHQKSVTFFLCKLQNSAPVAALVTVICTTKHHQPHRIVEGLAESNHCDGEIKDESEGDPPTPALDGRQQHGRRSVAASYLP